MKDIVKVYAIVVTLFSTILFFGAYPSQKSDSNEVNLKILPQIVKPIDLSNSYSFAGESIPVELQDVKERLDRELTVNSYWHSSTILNIKNSFRFFPVMDKILEEEGLPTDLKFIAVAESNLRNETSPRGAKGIWQFMKETAKYYDLEISDEIDERYNLEKSTRAAAKHLKELHQKLGSWSLVAAAYNLGETKLKREIQNQGAENYYELNLNPETDRYLFRLVALKEIISDPQKYGFYLDQEDVYPPLDFYFVEVSTTLENLGEFAADYGISYRELKRYNPWLISHKLTNPRAKTYKIKIPKRRNN